MKKDFLDKQKKKLTAERNEILDSLTGRNDQLTSLGGATESGDDADIASDTIDRTLFNSLGQADQNRLAMIDRALDRITQGTYGICLECGEPIAETRLEAIPYATFCVECQHEYERRQ
ncbi:MAG: TraR/DksA family transcriptional regulator [Spirochaetia bacterium]|uniref:TraR/DksA family transcriptional regulator n=1 Tax=Treponema sp. TaxID=166 RepID=UPI00298DC405|nr:TraR/DksA family transcriptional regulator [Treponema sp.]MCI7398454.1 TraR/DksA family transcriptional regulator [Spirochaetia bacterium]MCI7577556.1 TraR/DksA family transcriptional regulator [Spirochaetia bacterium]